MVAHGPELAAGPVPRPSDNSETESSRAPAGSSEDPRERLVLSALRPLFDRSLHGEVGRPNPFAQNFLTQCKMLPCDHLFLFRVLRCHNYVAEEEIVPHAILSEVH